MGKVYVFIPAHNEENQISETISEIRSSISPDEIVVVDDGSSDRTAELSENSGARVIRIFKNIGKGRALRKVLYDGPGRVLNNDDIIILADADLGKSASELEKLLEPVVSGKADLAIAIFPPARLKGGFGLVKKLSGFILRKCCKREFRAPLSGQRAFRASLLPQIEPAFRYGFGLETAMTIRAFRSGARIEEVETELFHRETGRNLSGFFHRGRQFLSVLRAGIDSLLGRL